MVIPHRLAEWTLLHLESPAFCFTKLRDASASFAGRTGRRWAPAELIGRHVDPVRKERDHECRQRPPLDDSCQHHCESRHGDQDEHARDGDPTDRPTPLGPDIFTDRVAGLLTLRLPSCRLAPPVEEPRAPVRGWRHLSCRGLGRQRGERRWMPGVRRVQVRLGGDSPRIEWVQRFSGVKSIRALRGFSSVHMTSRGQAALPARRSFGA